MPAIELTSVMQHEIIATFSAGLAQAFVEHVDDLWPAGEPCATPQWIAGNIDEVLAVIERLYRVGLEGHPGSDGFLDRMAWLPALLESLDEPVPFDG